MLQNKKEPWKNAERYYCACCNVWMGSDRQSILIHENGKKHRENMEASLRKRREDKLQEEKDSKAMEKTLKIMEEAASKAHATDMATGSFARSYPLASAGPGPLAGSLAASDGTEIQKKSNGELQSWKNRQEKRKKVDSEKDDNLNKELKPKRPRIELGPNEGHYQKGEDIYLEGKIYATIFEEDMPVQIWTGSPTINVEYRKSDEVKEMWKTGIILRVRRNTKPGDNAEEIVTCDVSYLNNLNDEDETIEKNVIGERLRLILGADDLIPATIEEARLSLMGGEEVITMSTGVAQIDENTGLTSWGTVSVRKVTVSQEVKEERARIRVKRREQLEKEKTKEKEIEARKMEEAKHTNADDSALGAYDVWSTSSGKGGYKGVQIHTDAKVEVSDMAKSLAKGKVDVKFKKAGSNKKSILKRAKKKQNRRKTFADDDDE